jgi:hypothetical protein
MKSTFFTLLTFSVITFCSLPVLNAQAFVDVETGVAFTGYNDVAIPSDTGTKISLKDDTSSNYALALRIRAGYTFANRHTVFVLAAPLTVLGSAVIDRDLQYQGKTFTAGTQVDSMYRFNSFRLTYRYTFINMDAFILAGGLTGKIRSADIALMSENAYAHRSDLGVVPLINFMTCWKFNDYVSLLLDADALVTPFGRAEDALFAVQYNYSPNATLRLGYRVLEGGSDGGGNVYTFALFHYITAGVIVSF